MLVFNLVQQKLDFFIYFLSGQKLLNVKRGKMYLSRNFKMLNIYLLNSVYGGTVVKTVHLNKS